MLDSPPAAQYTASMPNLIRAFIAIELPPEVIHALAATIKSLQPKVPATALRWTALKNLHLTLRFLGESSPQALQQVSQQAGLLASAAGPFELDSGGLGVFPNLRQPRIVWAGLTLPAALIQLQNDLEIKTQRCGYAAERKPFTPHLTLARVRDGASHSELSQLSQTIQAYVPQPPVHFTVSQLTLFRSDLKPEGPVYTRLAVFPFAAAGDTSTTTA